MPFRTYLVKQYSFKHENSFFRTIAKQLNNRFKDSDGLNVLIGNLSCNGHELDALFISKGKIIVIDFKDYGGQIYFSENNPWKISKDGDFIFVKGGGGIRNPFQQVNAYRHSLIQFLGNRLNEFLDKNHNDVDLGHISTMVLFHQSVTYDKSTIPHNISKFFNIVDNSSFIGNLLDSESKKLNFSDCEIEKILSNLDINASNEYDVNADTINEAEYKSTPQEQLKYRGHYFEKLLKTLEVSENKTINILNYYQTLVQLESFKNDNKLNNPSSISINQIIDDSLIKIDFDKYPKLKNEIFKNLQEQFPQNIYFAINFKIDEQIIPLLSYIINARDFDEKNDVLLKEFTLNRRELEQKELPEDIIEEIGFEILKKHTLTEKIEILTKYLGPDIELLKEITFAFSEDDIYTSQLKSELKKIIKRNLVHPKTLLSNFLLNIPLNNSIKPIPKEEFIRITNLNSSQKESVFHALNQELTVITGPPGNGKTQVVLNILANAIIHDKKVLLASKNNMAIDNVKDRFSLILNQPDYFIRFGTKDAIRDGAKIHIDQFIKKIKLNTLPSKEGYDKIYNQLKDYKSEIKNNSDKLDLIPIYKNSVQELNEDIKQNKIDLSTWQTNKLDILSISRNINEETRNKLKSLFINKKNEILAKKSGFFGFLFSLLHFNRIRFEFLNICESLPDSILSLIEARKIFFKNQTIKHSEVLINICLQIINLFDELVSVQNEFTRFKDNITEKEVLLQKKENELQYLLSEENNIKSQIAHLQLKIENLYPILLNEKINLKLHNADLEQIVKYKEYIPDNIPWKDVDLFPFYYCCSSFLDTFNATTVTNLSIANSIPLNNEIYDIVVIDEASQCDIASAIPLILRAKQLVVIGDPLQLKHISSLNKYEEDPIIERLNISDMIFNYRENSLYDYCFNLAIKSKTESVYIKEHLRCHPEIIGFSNEFYYTPLMGQGLEIKTNIDSLATTEKGIFWRHIGGMQDPKKKQNPDEATKCVELAVSLAKKYENISIGITTPFSDQAQLIKFKIPNELRNRIKADTVHKFQGDEKDVMIFSPVITFNTEKVTSKWLNEKVKYLINVAVTRAKSALYIVGNFDSCKKLDKAFPLYQLANYVEQLEKLKK